MSKGITEVEILESPSVRGRHLDQVAVLNKVGTLAMLPDDVHATTEAVAKFYDVPEATLKSAVKEHRAELESNGYRVVRGPELRELVCEMGSQSLKLTPKARSLALFTRRAVLNAGMLLRDSNVAKQVRAYLLEVEEAAPPDLRKSAYQRLVEKVQNREFRDLIAENATDYAPKDHATRMVFAQAQNLLYGRIVGMTAAELKASREIQNWDGKTGPTKNDRNVAKNYLTEEELIRLTKLETLLMARAEVMFGDGHTLTLADWLELIRSESTPQQVARSVPTAPTPSRPASPNAGTGPGRGSPRRSTQRGRSTPRQPRG